MIRTSRAGFTLIEMIVVLIVIGITAGLIAPAIMRMSGVRTDDPETAPVAARSRSGGCSIPRRHDGTARRGLVERR
jgi:prepilin-type N-terminal cleavage/methylation domain-containing protein